jgi:type 1 fimbriae regulatory protein FimE
MTDTSPTTENRTLRRLPNAVYRPREYLTEKEVDRLIEAARKRGRNGARDAAAILLAYRHGLRAQELCSLRWSQIDLRNGRLHVNRAKGGMESVHPLHGPELRALRTLQGSSPYVFVTEAGTYSLVRIVADIGRSYGVGHSTIFRLLAQKRAEVT